MTDARLRDLERRFSESGAPGDEVLYLRERLRGEAPSREVLWRLLQLLPAGDPSRAEHADALMELVDDLGPGRPASAQALFPRRLGAALLEAAGDWGKSMCFRAWSEGRPATVWLTGPEPGPHRPDPALIEADLDACRELRHANLVELRGWSRTPQAHLLGGVAPEGALVLAQLSEPLPRERALRLVQRLAAAVAAGHARGLAHGDVTASSVMVSADGEPWLRPFGELYLQELERVDQQAPGPLAGTLVGPLHERCPEELQGRRLTPRSDVFQLGILAYWLLTGKQPFKGSTHMETLQLILTEEPPFLGERALDELFELALARNPEERFPSAADFADALGEL